MDKTWMKADRRSLQFDLGFNQFLKVALDNARDPNNILCPCLKCCNNRFGNIQFIKDHVYFNGKEAVLENEELVDGRDGSILEDVIAPKESTNVKGVQKGQLDCKLAVDTVENIVAFGCIVHETLIQTSKQSMVFLWELKIGIKFYYAQKTKKSSRVSVEWIPLLGIPEQKDGKTCAYLVMRYMKDIIADKYLEFATTVRAFDAKIFIFDLHGLRYTPDQIDKVRAE
ncbi:hypothetical protein ACLB2K_059955 [Fragaria x ananassa]